MTAQTMMACYWRGSDLPRALKRRHTEDCPGAGEDDVYDEECRGCQPCPERHCSSCGRDHPEQGWVCAGCLAEVRADVENLLVVIGAAPAYARSKGQVDSEAFFLISPAANIEARANILLRAEHLGLRHLERWMTDREIEIAANADGERRAWLEVATHEHHPLLVLGTWAMVGRDALDIEQPIEQATVLAEAVWILEHLHQLGACDGFMFSDLLRDVAATLAHAERVLHDGEQIDEGAPCLDCRKPLVKIWGTKDQGAAFDSWNCPRCGRDYSAEEYGLVVAQEARRNASWLTDRDAEIRFGIKAATVRKLASRGQIYARVTGERSTRRVFCAGCLGAYAMGIEGSHDQHDTPRKAS